MADEASRRSRSRWKYINQPLPDWVAGTMRARFEEIHRRRFWEEGESVSGPGSSLAQAQGLIRELPRIWVGLGVRTVLDAPCGDFNWMRKVDLSSVDYIGVDIVAELIQENRLRYEGERTRFLCLDFTQDDLPVVDLILCRDGLVHLSFKDIFKALGNFVRSKATYLMATTFPNLQSNRDIETGDWRPLNLEQAPFDFPAPLQLLTEGCPEPGFEDKAVGVWELGNHRQTSISKISDWDDSNG